MCTATGIPDSSARPKNRWSSGSTSKSPFGKRETQMKWVDPDPNYDQSAQWGVVDQGPESLMLEQINLISLADWTTVRLVSLTTLAFTMGWGMSFSLLFARLTGILHARASIHQQ